MIRCRWWLRSCGLGLVLIPMLALAAGPAPELASQAGHSKGVYRIAFSRDGRRLVTASADGTARLWDLETALEVRAFVGHTKYVKTVAFSPDGALVLTGSEDRTVRGWDTATGQPRFTLEGLEREVEAVAVAPDGQSFACGDGPAVALYRVDASPTKIETLAGHGDRIRFSAVLARRPARLRERGRDGPHLGRGLGEGAAQARAGRDAARSLRDRGRERPGSGRYGRIRPALEHP